VVGLGERMVTVVGGGIGSISGPPRSYLTRDDFRPIVQEIVNRHPGLEFLESTPEFQLRYGMTMVSLLLYTCN
jgi:serine/threonine-protein phosphatase 2A regulatory subunit B''